MVNPFNREEMFNSERLVILETDTKWIKKQFEAVVPKIESMHNTFIKGEGKIATLNKTVYGNGKKGIVEKVDILMEAHDQMIGRNKLVSAAVGSGWLLTLVLLGLNLAGVI